MTEAWLSGPVPGIAPLLQPVAHGLLNARQQISAAVDGLTPDQLSSRPGDAASISYHVLHAVGSLDRLFTYARGETLSADQRSALAAEVDASQGPVDAAMLVETMDIAIEKAFKQLAETSEELLTETRGVGRAQLPSTVIGLLFHGAEHTARHAGQAVTTAKIIRTLSS